jgi:outer membrane protein assembly factor BamB
MLKLFKLIYLLSLVYATSCSLIGIGRDEIDNNLYPKLWEYNFEIGYFSTINPILNGNRVIYSSLDERRTDFMASSTLEALDKENGKHIWKWDGMTNKPSEKFYFEDRYYVSNSILYISSGVDYAINLENGITNNYLNDNKSGGQAFFGNGNEIYSIFNNSVNNSNTVGTIIKRMNTVAFSWKTIFENNFTDSSVISFSQILFDDLNPNLLYLPFTFGYFGLENFYPGLMIYSLSESKIILEKLIPISGSKHFIDNLSIIDKDKIYIPAYGKIICINKNTGELLWQNNVNGNTSSSGILFPENNLLYVNTEFGVYCINPETGAVIWSKLNGEKEGNSSRMQYHNGVIYYIGGGMFHARDANTGEKLLFFEAPSFAKDGGAFFQPVMTIDQENDKIYTASYTHAYCYPTLR